MRCFLFCAFFTLLLISFTQIPVVFSENDSFENDIHRILYGNVYGTIYDSSSGALLAGSRVFVTVDPIVYVSETNPSAVASDRGWIILPETGTSVCSARSGSDGAYIVNNIPVTEKGSRYNVIIQANQNGPVIIDSALILPGAIMALQVDVQMTGNSIAHIVAAGRTTPVVVTNTYRHDLLKGVGQISGATFVKSSDRDHMVSVDSDDALTLTIYATREGLVGGTTANGYVIKERDHFVALPSTQVLCSKGGYEFQVKLEHNGYTEIVPVWDIGPWNIHDNYWALEDERTIYQYLKDDGQGGGLGQGLPEAQAAYQDDFNSGRDEYRRRVVNPAGIDLADGTFWDGLNLSDNAWITVKYLWLEDDGEDETCFIGTAKD